MAPRPAPIPGMPLASNGKRHRRRPHIISPRFPSSIVARTNIRPRRLLRLVTSHATHWHHFEDLEHQQQATLFGMWIFLATEILIFGGIFTAYTVYRIAYVADFEVASR